MSETVALQPNAIGHRERCGLEPIVCVTCAAMGASPYQWLHTLGVHLRRYRPGQPVQGQPAGSRGVVGLDGSRAGGRP
jgi:hypothetical protein